MIESLVIAGAILASAVLLSVILRPKPDAYKDDKHIRMIARSLVRAIEKRSEWDLTISSEHVKRARVRLVLMEMFPDVEDDWIDVIIEEAVFDMEAHDGSADGNDRFEPGQIVGEHRFVDEMDDRDREPTGAGTAPGDWGSARDTFGDEVDGEDFPIPHAG